MTCTAGMYDTNHTGACSRDLIYVTKVIASQTLATRTFLRSLCTSLALFFSDLLRLGFDAFCLALRIKR